MVISRWVVLLLPSCAGGIRNEPGLVNFLHAAQKLAVDHNTGDFRPEEGPDLEGLAGLLESRLLPLRRDVAVASLSRTASKWQAYPDHFLGTCVQATLPGSPGAGCQHFDSLEDAKNACENLGPSCGGVIAHEGSLSFECRASGAPEASPYGEIAYVKESGNSLQSLAPEARGLKIWETFHDAVMEAMADRRYNLSANEKHLLQPGRPGVASSVKDDGTIFLTVAAYRDWNCDSTIAEAFRKADHPHKVNVAIVEMNCREEPCWTGTGWGNTRRIVPAPPDEDCYDELRKQADMQPHLAAGRVKTLRLHESQAFGPFFSRYLAMKMYTGQSYILQVDAHSKFRHGWDSSMISQLKATPSFPRSVISNYPPPSVSDRPLSEDGEHTSPPALCSFTFSDGVVRLEHGMRSFRVNGSSDIPRHSMYVAAGFFAAHASLLSDVPFDPLLPFVFMGEEIVMSTRFWTSGWDIYGPTQDLVSHEYVRKEAPKFWETVDHEFGPGTQNSMYPIVLQRVRNIIRWPGDAPPKPANLLDLVEQYGLGTWRHLDEFWENAGVDLAKKMHGPVQWCRDGLPPKYALLQP